MKQKQQNALVINGKTYDAVTGLPVVHHRVPKTPSQEVKISPAAQPTRVVSDIVRPATPVNRPSASVSASTHHAHQVPPTHHAAHHQQATAPFADVQARSIHRQPERTHALYKGVQHRAVAPSAGPVNDIVAHRAPSHLNRAANIPRHQAINHFATKKEEPVAPEPIKDEAVEKSAALTQLTPAAVAQDVAIQPHSAEGSQAMSEKLEHMLADHSKSQPETIHGSHHKADRHEHRVKQFFAKQPKLLSAATGALAVLLFVGYLVYLNIPNISLRIAANRAGFSATMPAYKPSGYSLTGPVAYTAGEIQLKYGSNAAPATAYTLTQRQSTWDTQALLQNYVTKQSSNYMTYQDEGLTIYIYNGDAAWVNGGIFYSVAGNANLSSDQILNIATSM
ncbi:MAG TPA: hypothetical protein VGS28_04710 [Candidatus Saccharimonadales bacterium]|nr:hypothetical protein [Candidatus Saccharimonadales bacterium]